MTYTALMNFYGSANVSLKEPILSGWYMRVVTVRLKVLKTSVRLVAPTVMKPYRLGKR
jgi:hypothetical protein